MPRRPRARGASLFEELVFAADRDRIPGARPVVSFTDRDDRGLLRELAATTHANYELSRRGAWHGSWAELDLGPLGLGARHAAADATLAKQRWQEARPILLAGLVGSEGALDPGSLAEAFELFEELPTPGALAAWMRARAELLPRGCELRGRRARLSDPERDIEKVHVSWSGAGGRERHDLWLKTGWLSDHPDDASLRLRVSFGREIEDDASHDEHLHQLVSELAQSLLPHAPRVSEHAGLAHALQMAIGQEVYYSQHIAYWNSPEGGASFHHDAFEEPDSGGQLGVCYAQLAGRTAWIALSLADLAARVREFCEHLARGASPWLCAQLYPRGADFERLLARVEDEPALLRELALPGCGSLGPLVNRGPEFTSFLADAGHALVLHAGDVLLLPNHGLRRTAMHSVFCASDRPTYALSMAVRALHPPAPPEPQAAWLDAQTRMEADLRDQRGEGPSADPDGADRLV